MREANYPIAFRGRATSFTQSEVPTDFALEMKNRFINAAGGAEKRRGIQQKGNAVSGAPAITGIHELILADGSAVLMVSGGGAIYRFDDPDYTQVHSGLDSGSVLYSVQFDDKLIFVNGVDRNFFTEDGTTFTELRAVIDRGAATTGTDATELQDENVDDWTRDSEVAENDIVRNLTRNASGIVTAVTAASVAHTPMSASSTGIGVTSSGAATAGDRYEIIDTVELNIIPTSGEPDNVGELGAGSGVATVAVTGVNFLDTDIRVGDYIRNTTRSAVTQVTSIATALGVHGITSQTAGDSVTFHKSAMPITTRAHVHFGRLYMIDARDQHLIRISGPNNPEDLTAGAGTLDSTTFKFGTQQPEGDTAIAMGSFQRFFVVAGRQNLYLFQGTDPIADVSGGSTDFEIIGLFPQGSVSPDGVVSIGNDLVFVTPDGVQSVSLAGDASTLGRANLSENIKTTLRDELAGTPTSEIIAFHYPRRSWFLLKVGSQIHVFNYTAYFGQDLLSQRRQGSFTPERGSWSIFDGKFCRQSTYLVRRDRTMLCAGAQGLVYEFDLDGVFDDDGEVYSTRYQPGWLTMDEPAKSVRIKKGVYIRPIIDAGANITYTVTAEAGFDGLSRDTLEIVASGGATPIGLAAVGQAQIGGTSIQDTKYPLRWRGKEARFTFDTNDALGPDTLSRFTVYHSQLGRE